MGEALKARKWTVLGATLATMLAASVAFGEPPTACEVAYLTSGPPRSRQALKAHAGSGREPSRSASDSQLVTPGSVGSAGLVSKNAPDYFRRFLPIGR
jgi:hypothetical protein